MHDVHWCVTVDYQQIANDNIANQIDGFTIDYGKFIQKMDKEQEMLHPQQTALMTLSTKGKWMHSAKDCASLLTKKNTSFFL